ncbi:RNA polymerase sigma factor SigI [Robertmurraya siralis]|uniref:RNA polymerase sigma factor SigI n=1 Tax=Robertmurraya siralis TaxID=77777 RepID=A0A919WGD1_9BACI|nr:RNA polymerase sigma-I factor [Bacillus sp. 7504-2]GIN61277.1 RNA polymerase sigma factor SigI [Robertmurraya siralis]
MFGLIFMAKKKKQSLEEIVQSIQQGDHSLENELIETYKPFVAKSVSSICKRYITETDDEFSIGLIAFNEAIQKYDPSKGRSLLSFADILIKRKVIDYIRSQAKYKNISLEINDEFEEDSQHSSIEAQLSIDEFHRKMEAEYRKSEIIQFAGILQQYDLSFDELVKNSPKHADARKNAMKVAQTLVEQAELKQYLLEKKKLPIKQLEETVKVSRKTIERNRKYIIAISLILLGDYLYLRDYIKGVLET